MFGDQKFLRDLNSEKTIHEGKYTDQQNGVVCFCSVISNDTAARTSKVRCIAPNGHPMEDKTIDAVRTIQPFATSDADELYCAPPVGSQGILIVIESTPFILGFYNPDETGRDLNDPEAPPLAGRQALANGDFVFHNAFKSRLLVRNFGLIEIQSTENLKSVYIPDRDVLEVTCQNYHLRTNGGFTSWETTDSTTDTLLTVVAQDNISATNIMRFDVGENADDVMFDAKIGPPNESIDVDETVYRNTIKDDGDWTMSVTDKAIMNITPAGDWTSLFKGALKETVTGTFDSKSDGTMSLETGDAFNLTVAANAIIECINIDIKSSGKGTLGAGANEAVVLGNQMEAFLQAVVATFNSHAHQYVSPGGPALSSPPTGPMTPPTPALLSKKWTVE